MLLIVLFVRQASSVDWNERQCDHSSQKHVVETNQRVVSTAACRYLLNRTASCLLGNAVSEQALCVSSRQPRVVAKDCILEMHPLFQRSGACVVC